MSQLWRDSDRVIGGLQVGIGALITALYLSAVAVPIRAPWLFWSIVALGLLWALWNKFGPRRLAPDRRWDLASSALKAVLIAVMLQTTGGVHSPFVGVLYFAVVSVAVRRELWTVIASTILYCIAFVALALATGTLVSTLPTVPVHVIMLGFTATAAAYLSERALRLRVDEALRTRLLDSVLTAQDAERRRLARELHDGIGQSLASLAVRLRLFEESAAEPKTRRQAAEQRAIAEAALDDVVRLSRGLHPSALDELGFAPAVDRLVADHGAEHGVRADSVVQGFTATPPLPVEVATALYRILQEALRNSAQHAQARAVSVLVDRSDDRVRMIVEDDGRGFAPQAPPRDGLGLHSIRERVGLLGGTLTIDSEPGDGTTLAVDLPLASR
jgi:signal transduction histidine kinase